MSTRCNIHFVECGEVVANVYKHSDGYPDGEHGIPALFERFFANLESQASDRRYNHPEYLAARFVVWVSNGYTTRYEKKPLDFLSIGVCVRDHGDIEYVYTVDCKDEKRPAITWEER